MPDVETVDTVGIPSEQTKIYIKIGADFTRIPNIKTITPPGASVEEVERVYLGTTVKRYRPSTIYEAGEITGTINYDPNNTVHQTIAASIGTGVVHEFKITYFDGMVTPAFDTFEGFFRELSPSDAEDATDLEFEYTIRIDGEVTRTAGAAA